MKNFILLIYILASTAQADLSVIFIKESKLPYDFSPNNYNNSSNNYDNSINNYSNSPNNYTNSENNYDNGVSNYNNGMNGDNRLILKENGKSYRVGYYVRADNGILNFFSIKGKRIFYNPNKSIGVYDGKKGFFCGVLARTNDKYQLVLTEKGEQLLMMNQ